MYFIQWEVEEENKSIMADSWITRDVICEELEEENIKYTVEDY